VVVSKSSGALLDPTLNEETGSMTTNGRDTTRNGTKPQDPLEYLKHMGKDVMHGFDAAVDRVMNKSRAIKEAEAKFGIPGASDIEVRFEGLLHRKNPEDSKRYEAKKANRDRGVLTADQLKLLGGFAANGQKYVLDVGTHLTEITNALPEELQPVGETLTNASLKILSMSYIESLQFLAERGFQTIDQATPPGQYQQ
jgi:hypothetical protein